MYVQREDRYDFKWKFILHVEFAIHPRTLAQNIFRSGQILNKLRSARGKSGRPVFN